MNVQNFNYCPPHLFYSKYCLPVTVRGKILEWEKIGEFGELWSLLPANNFFSEIQNYFSN